MARRFQPRYSLQWLFIATTLVAVLLVFGRWWWLRTVKLENRAAEIERQVQSYANTAWGIQRFGDFTNEADSEAKVFWEAYLEGQVQAAHLRRAKWRPWLSTREKPITNPYNTD